MISLNNILNDLSEQKINKVVETSIIGGGKSSKSSKSSSSSNSSKSSKSSKSSGSSGSSKSGGCHYCGCGW